MLLIAALAYVRHEALVEPSGTFESGVEQHVVTMATRTEPASPEAKPEAPKDSPVDSAAGSVNCFASELLRRSHAYADGAWMKSDAEQPYQIDSKQSPIQSKYICGPHR